MNELAAMARILIRGVVVVLGEPHNEVAEFQNIMFLPASPENIPWRDHYFTKIYLPRHLERMASQEATRLLAPGGEIVSGTAYA